MAGYIGNSPSDSSVRIARQIYTTSGSQTDYTFAAGYDPGYIEVYVNGSRQTEGTNFTANDGSKFSILNYGLGINNLTPGQKNVLIFGGLAFAFACFLSLYSLH